MEAILNKQLDQLVSSGADLLIKGALHGIEKEGLRVDNSGNLSQTSHPIGLGSALTNNTITTDYSEALLELITPVFKTAREAIYYLENLHNFTYRQLGGELIWAGSMPCTIADADAIPIARFGSSNIGKMKYIYRIGLGYRYGRMMQTIAGIHYNFSLTDDFWHAFQRQKNNRDSMQSFRSSSYFKMIRNFRRHSWLLLYLFGASPALSNSFMKGKEHGLKELYDKTLYLPYATSLRMSDLGYSTQVQSSLNICFNHLDTYIDSLDKAITTPYPAYEKIGIKVNGEYRQLNDTILQIENEYYSDIRPKRVTGSSERSLRALRQRGVQYIEVRNTDINPFLPAGIDIRQSLFLDVFLISCLLIDDQEISPVECKMVNNNLQKVISRGREPGLELATRKGVQQLSEIGTELLEKMYLTSEVLDQVHETKDYSNSVAAQMRKLEDSSLTPSAKVLHSLKRSGCNYVDWILQKSREHRKASLQSPCSKSFYDELVLKAETSLEQQRQQEAAETVGFDQFLQQYLAG